MIECKFFGDMEIYHSLLFLLLQILKGPKQGELVFLVDASTRKARGIVHSTDPCARCGFESIGATCVAIHVLESFDDTFMIPFETMDARNMSQAVGSIIKWPLNGIIKDNDSTDTIEEIYVGTSKETSKETIFEQDDGLIDRENWKQRRVILWEENRTIKVGEGVVLLVHPYEAIDCRELGESNLGVIIEGSLPPSKLGVSEVGCLNLVSWPIRRITFENGEPLMDTRSSSNPHGNENETMEENVDLTEDLDAFSDDDDIAHNHEDEEEADTGDTVLGLLLQQDNVSEHDATTSDYNCIDGTKRKRSYVHRTRVQKHIKKNPTFNKRCDVAEIHKVAMVDCCVLRCCQFGNRSKIMQARSNLWGQSYSSRCTFILDCMSMAYKQGQEGDDCFEFSFDGKKVCNKAWYVMHGIGRSTFYRLKQKFINGAKIATHGNLGIIRKQTTHVEMAKAIIQGFIDNNADQMPHKLRTSMHGTRETQQVLPSMYKQVDILREVNDTLVSLNYKTLSQPTFSRLWNTVFKTVSLSKSSTFSKCDICTAIKAKLESTRNQEERAKYFAQRRAHMLQQMSCRNMYYAWRSTSEMYPNKFLCIIHDKMDQSKTAIPQIKPVPKSLNGVERLPVSLTGMLTHGHGQTAYGHFALGLWPSDPNFTIASLSKCLRNLERNEKHMYGDLTSENLDVRSQTNIFDCVLSTTALYHHMKVSKEENKYYKQQSLADDPIIMNVSTNEGTRNDGFEEENECTRMQGPSISHAAEDVPSGSRAMPFKSLPRTLLLQLDNCGSENKNRYVFAYLSLLVARGVFDMVQLGFLMVGHTHEDIDALFSRFSEKLRKKTTFTFPHLMKLFNECVTMQPAPFLLQKVANFKDFVKGCLHDGADSLVGHSKPLQFRFYMSDGIPLMQYKIHPKNVDWLPESGIELWKRDELNHPKLPEGVPEVLPPFEYVKDCEKLVEGLKRYVNWWKEHLQDKGEDSDYAVWIKPVIKYWENLITTLQTPSASEHSALFHDFWPRSVCEHVLVPNNVDEVDPNDELDENEGQYCGPMRNKPANFKEFNATLDVEKGDFVLVQPCDVTYPIWLGQTTSDIDQNRESPQYNRVKIQYWAPISKKRNVSDEEVYRDCWTKYWRENKNDPQRWEDTSCIIWAWKPKGGRQPDKIKIPKSVMAKAKASLQPDMLQIEAPRN